MNAAIIFPSDQISCNTGSNCCYRLSQGNSQRSSCDSIKYHCKRLSQGNSQRSSCDSISNEVSLSQGNSQRSSCGSIKYHCHKETASVHLAAQSSITATRKQPAFILRLNQVSLPQGNSQRSSCGSIKYHCHKETASVTVRKSQCQCQYCSSGQTSSSENFGC